MVPLKEPLLNRDREEWLCKNGSEFLVVQKRQFLSIQLLDQLLDHTNKLFDYKVRATTNIRFQTFGTYDVVGHPNELFHKPGYEVLENIIAQIGDAIAAFLNLEELPLLRSDVLPLNLRRFTVSTSAYITRMDVGEQGLEHCDINDIDGAFEVTFGSYTGGTLVWPSLCVSTTMRPLDFVWFNSATLPHFNQPVKTGTRYALIFFTHKNTANAIQNASMVKLARECLLDDYFMQ